MQKTMPAGFGWRLVQQFTDQQLTALPHGDKLGFHTQIHTCRFRFTGYKSKVPMVWHECVLTGLDFLFLDPNDHTS